MLKTILLVVSAIMTIIFWFIWFFHDQKKYGTKATFTSLVASTCAFAGLLVIVLGGQGSSTDGIGISFISLGISYAAFSKSPAPVKIDSNSIDELVRKISTNNYDTNADDDLENQSLVENLNRITKENQDLQKMIEQQKQTISRLNHIVNG
jgi:hypothetical protein